MAQAYEVLKAKWKKRQDTQTVVFGATRDAVVTKLKSLVQTVRFLFTLFQLLEQRIMCMRNFISNS